MYKVIYNTVEPFVSNWWVICGCGHLHEAHSGQLHQPDRQVGGALPCQGVQERSGHHHRGYSWQEGPVYTGAVWGQIQTSVCRPITRQVQTLVSREGQVQRVLWIHSKDKLQQRYWNQPQLQRLWGEHLRVLQNWLVKNKTQWTKTNIWNFK